MWYHPLQVTETGAAVDKSRCSGKPMALLEERC
jgi:hypothetical protein